MSPDPMRDLEVCVIEKTSGLLFEWGGHQTVNIYDSYEYVEKMLNNSTEPLSTFGMFMLGGEKPTYEDFISGVHDHLDLIDGSEGGEETG